MKNPKVFPTNLQPIEDPREASAILSAIEKFDLTSSPGWDALDELSSQTVLEGLEANPDGIFNTPAGKFEAVGTAYVTLNYGGKRDAASMPDSFPVRIIGSFDRTANKVTIEDVQVDTSSFFE
ncbi:hypothetical protein [Bradyrhizobium sp. RT3b]|uniref:pPIWI-associating nuclease domain-containing protein n=1 Tax=Bradyrhizobium sp. RT3b TaxID=3156334 RepID=UPI0033986D49